MDFAPLAKGRLPQALVQRPRAGRGWCERFRAAPVGPGALLVRSGRGVELWGALPFKPLLRASQGFLRPVLSRIRAGPPTKPL